MFEHYQKLCLIGVLVSACLVALFTYGYNFYGIKIKEMEKNKPKAAIDSDTKPNTITNTYNVSGDVVQGDKIDNSRNNLSAPNALIATVNQSGGQNTVNYFQNEYRPLNENIKEQISKNIQSLTTQYPSHPQVLIQIEHGNANGHKVAKQLSNIFEQYNLGKYNEGNVIMGQLPPEPITIVTNSANKDFVDDLTSALSPYINVQYNIDLNDGFSTAFIKFHIYGTVTFDLNGVVKIQ